MIPATHDDTELPRNQSAKERAKKVAGQPIQEPASIPTFEVAVAAIQMADFDLADDIARSLSASMGRTNGQSPAT